MDCTITWEADLQRLRAMTIGELAELLEDRLLTQSEMWVTIRTPDGGVSVVCLQVAGARSRAAQREQSALRCPPDLHERAKAFGLRRGLTVTELVRVAVERELGT